MTGPERDRLLAIRDLIAAPADELREVAIRETGVRQTVALEILAERERRELSSWSSDALHNVAKWDESTRGKAARAILAEREQRDTLPPPPSAGPAPSDRMLAWVSRLAEAVHYDTYGTGTMTQRDAATTLLAAVGPPPSNEPGEPQ